MISLLRQKYTDKSYAGIDLTEALIALGKKQNVSDAEFVLGDC